MPAEAIATPPARASLKRLPVPAVKPVYLETKTALTP